MIYEGIVQFFRILQKGKLLVSFHLARIQAACNIACLIAVSQHVWKNLKGLMKLIPEYQKYNLLFRRKRVDGDNFPLRNRYRFVGRST
jgi:hypothetical protein